MTAARSVPRRASTYVTPQAISRDICRRSRRDPRPTSVASSNTCHIRTSGDPVVFLPTSERQRATGWAWHGQMTARRHITENAARQPRPSRVSDAVRVEVRLTQGDTPSTMSLVVARRWTHRSSTPLRYRSDGCYPRTKRRPVPGPHTVQGAQRRSNSSAPRTNCSSTWAAGPDDVTDPTP